MKVRAKNLVQKDRIEILDALYTAAGTVRGRNAMKIFLRDLLTESERIMLGRRIVIARLLIQGKQYGDIREKLGVGYDTIFRVQQWLRDQMPGYEDAIAGLEKELEKRGRKTEQRAVWRALKRKYPLHFLFWNIADEMKKRRAEKKSASL